MKSFEIEKDGAVLILRRTTAGRVRLGVQRAAQTFPWAVTAFVVLLGIEFVGRGMPVALWPFYVASIIGLSASIGLAFGLSRGLRNDIWAIDVGENVLAYESSMPWGGLRSAGIDLSEVTGLRLNSSHNALVIEIGESQETLAESKNEAELRALAEEINVFLTRKGADLRIENLG